MKWSIVRLDLRSNLYNAVAYSYCETLIMVTIIRQVLTNFFQTEHVSAVKFALGYKKNMTFLACDTKNLQKFEKML